MTCEYVVQGTDADMAWWAFVLDQSEGFTQSRVERINDSFRTYVWAILGAQAQKGTPILGTATAFDAPKQFLANVENAIISPVHLPKSIAQYQDVLQYAKSKVDFVFGMGLCMVPSDMDLHVAQIQEYNNEVIVATEEQTHGGQYKCEHCPNPCSCTWTCTCQ